MLKVFWKQLDPTDPDGQFVDRGKQYRTAIFYHSDEQKKMALDAKNRLDKSKKYQKPVATAIEKAAKFYSAEDYHQNYLEKRGMKTCGI